MEIGVDSFIAATVDAAGRAVDPAQHLSELLEAIRLADEVGLDVFGIGEHHRREFLDSAPTVILAAAAARTRNIRLTSAVTVLSAADPVRVFQEFATLDLLSNGRAEIVAGRGSFIEAFPLFGLELEDYDSLFAEKLDLLLKIRENTHVRWSGKHRAPLTGQGVYPRPLQNPLPVWLGVGGTPGSFIRAGMLGLPLMVAIIGGEPHRFRPLIDRYRDAGLRAGHSPDRLKVGIHSLGYVADSASKAANEFFPGYARSFSEIGKERGWPPVTRAHFDALLGPTGALIVGDPETVAGKILGVNESLGGISRLTFQMSVAALPHAKLMHAIELLGTRVAPLVRTALASETAASPLLTNSQYKRNGSTTNIVGRIQNAEVTYNMIKIAIILGSTRPGRNGEAVAKWVYEAAKKRSDAEFELVDIKDFNLPLLDEPVPPIMGQYSKPHTKAWAARIGSFDAYVFVTPEYNHGTSGALKNAIDFLFAEWSNKAAGFVSYGGASGARAVEQLRLVLAEVEMASVRNQVLLSMYTDFENFSVFKPGPTKEQSVNDMLDQVIAWGGALRTLRKTSV